MPLHTARRAAQMSPVLFALAFGAYAQTTEQADHAGHTMAAPAETSAGDAAQPAPASSDADQAFMAAMDKMHEGMAIELSGDPDIDFARGMIAHHQGAIDMAKVLLDHGDDPDMRALAEEIIAAQEAEIATMQAWLKVNAPSN